MLEMFHEEHKEVNQYFYVKLLSYVIVVVVIAVLLLYLFHAGFSLSYNLYIRTVFLLR